MISIVVAATIKNGIGIDGHLPWKLKTDMNFFRSLTEYNVVIMGRKTWESIPSKFRPLKNRHNIILTKNKTWKPEESDSILIYHSLDTALQDITTQFKKSKIFIIGGQSLYKESIKFVNSIFITRIFNDITCDTFFPEIPITFQRVSHEELITEAGFDIQSEKIYENDIEFEFQLYKRNLLKN